MLVMAPIWIARLARQRQVTSPTSSLPHAQVKPGSLKARIKDERLVVGRPTYMAYYGESPGVLEVSVERSGRGEVERVERQVGGGWRIEDRDRVKGGGDAECPLERSGESDCQITHRRREDQFEDFEETDRRDTHLS